MRGELSGVPEGFVRVLSGSKHGLVCICTIWQLDHVNRLSCVHSEPAGVAFVASTCTGAVCNGVVVTLCANANPIAINPSPCSSTQTPVH